MADTKPMSQCDYRQHGGGCCPFCLSSNISGGFVEIGAGEAYQRVNCNDCGRQWADTYQLRSYEETK